MSARSLRELNDDQLQARIEELQVKLIEAREAVLSGKDKNHRQLHLLKREIAQARTVWQERAQEA